MSTAPERTYEVGPYRLIRLMGEGGTGRVYHAVHVAHGQPVALKVPRGSALHEREAFRREIAALTRLSRLRDEGLVELLESGNQRGAPWYAMPFIDGPHLERFRKELWGDRHDDGVEQSRTMSATSPLARESVSAWSEPKLLPDASSPREAAAGKLELVLRLGVKLARTLALVHTHGVVHGDVTPRNVLLRGQSPVLIDFGTAFLAHVGDSARELPHRASIMGTRAYSAPERRRFEPLDARADIYALGCILYELVTNSRPLAAGDEGGEGCWIPASAHVTGVPTELDVLLLAMLASDPSERVGHASEVVAVLSRLLGESAPEGELARAAQLYRPRLLGRELALQELTDQLRAASLGAGGMIVLRGESGVGKTRLLNEVASWAPAFQVAIITAQFGDSHRYKSEAQLGERSLGGFAGFFDVLSDELEAAGEDAVMLDDELRDALATVRPYTSSAFAEVRSSALPGSSREQLLARLASLLGWLAKRRPFAIMFDDLQWADELTLAAIDHCADALARLPVLFVCSYRSDEAGAALTALTHKARAVISLDRLPSDAIGGIAKAMLGARTLPESLREFLSQRSQGNPLLVAEYLRAALSSEALRLRSSGTWTFDPQGVQSVPRSLEELFASRLARVSPHAADALRLAAVLGREFDLAALAALPGARQIAEGEAIEELVSRQLLEWIAPGRYRFAHDSLREAQERALEPGQRRELHRLAAEHLARDPEATPEQLGLHWALAEQPVAALPQLERAARSAHSEHAPLRAAELYRLALEQCRKASELASRMPALLEALADVLLVQARHADARTSYDECLQRLGEHASVARARVLRKLAASHWTVHEYEQARAYEERALAAIGPLTQLDDEGKREYIDIQFGRFERLYFSRTVGEETARLIDDLKPLVGRYAGPDRRCYFCACAACEVLARSGYALEAESEELARMALPASDETVPLQSKAHARFALGFVLSTGSVEQRREAMQWLERAEPDARRAGDSVLLARILTYRALTLLRTGEVEATASMAARALELAEQVELPPYVAAALSYQGWAAWRLNQRTQATNLLRKAVALWSAHPHSFPFQWSAALPLLDLALEKLSRERVEPLLAQLLHPSQQRLPKLLREAVLAALAKLDDPAALSVALRELLQRASALQFC